MFNLGVHHHHHCDLQGVMDLLKQVFAQGVKIMSAISDFKAKQDAHNAVMDAAVDGLVTDVSGLKDQITTFQNSAGKITPEDQALLDAIEVRTGAIADKLAALDAETPPVVPVSQE